MYGVRWDRNNKPPSTPADNVAKDFQDRMPVAVGTTPLDALLAYVAAHELTDTEELLAKISELLHAQSESLEDRRAAQDEVQNYNFARFAGGSHYVLNIDHENPAKPPEEKTAVLLESLNQSQSLFDSTARQVQQLQWALFSIWWKYSTDKQRGEKTAHYTTQVDQLRDQLQALEQILDQQSDAIVEAKGQIALDLKEATAPVLAQQQDPTLFLGDVRSGWPLDYLDPLTVRLGEHINQEGLPDVSNPADYGLNCPPDTLQDTATLLVREFLFYGDELDSSVSIPTPNESKDTLPPLYHTSDQDQWNDQQPWFPLFLEWEAEYYHVDYSEWNIESKTSKPSDARKFRYTIKQGNEPLWETDGVLDDRRKITGRILLLPQPVFSLQGQIKQLFSSTPEDVLDRHISKPEREKLLNEVINLPFVSAPLDGFTNHLLTLAEGSHLKPNIRYPGRQPQPLSDAAQDSSEIHIDEEAIRGMGLETDLTPYGSLVRLDTSPGADYPAFKPVTHGQFKFTKLNVIDKFGQAACVIDPRRRVEGPPPVFPCVSEYYEPQAYKDSQDPNVVERPNQEGDNQFIQVPPSVNQPARFHLNFVTLNGTDGDSAWRPVTEWENPIWGWVLVNYVNYGIQFFLPDGTFYREVRIAAPNNPNGGTQTDKWLPFKPPPTPSEAGQIDRLIDQFTDGGRDYLLAFMEMINIATVRAQSVPGAYSQCVNSVIGRPLALVNVGISLELGYAPKMGQSTYADQESKRQPRSLLPDDDADAQYEFAIKLGDQDRSYDGLVGYFRARHDPQEEDALELGNIYTPHELDQFPSDQIHLIGTDNFPRLKPFWLSPYEYREASDPASQFTLDRNKQQTTFGFLMDPFGPVNVYSSILPIEPLSLPPWTWESALKSMTAFFHFGPLVVAEDVPAYDASKRLEYDYKLTDDQQTVSGSNIKLPSLAVADWSWLQPYRATEGGLRATPEEEEAYMAMDIGKIDPVPTWEKGPLTAVEGFLQMKKSITAPEV
ncbi:hypothetical protein BDV25DRAFT_160969 [Aspergillus avenaceus]|uniref:Uncharacterized protein n=1 Tax=Aspergillus avenaceus TaxID=36643 RepID=A0A5N6TM21_ASPAV|nr:hypothetical protein BDV25DRAFT_160969 [Aspergillus avenaceus]